MPRSTICSVVLPARSCLTRSISATMRPARGRTMPRMHFISVLLPLPLVPSSTTVSPAATFIDTSSSTRTAPYDASTPSMERLLAKIRSDHRAILDDVGRQAVGDLLAGDQHGDALRERHHGPH